MSGVSGMVTFVVAAGSLAIALGFTRLLRGPTQVDRVVALELMFSTSIAFSAAAALSTGRALFLDVAIGLAVIGFVATIAWSRLIDLREKDPHR